MLDQNWVFFGAALGLLGSLRYAHATLRGRARPNRVTWALWATAPLVGFAAQVGSGVGTPAILTLAAGVGPLIVLTASWMTRYGTVRITRFDLSCGAISVIAIIAWLGFDRAPLAVVFAVLADATAAVPTVRKAWRDPDSENAVFYVLVAAGATITLLTITSWRPEAWVFAGYMLGVTVLLTAIIAVRRRQGRSSIAEAA